MLNPKPSGESGADGQVHGVAAPHAHPQAGGHLRTLPRLSEAAALPVRLCEDGDNRQRVPKRPREGTGYQGFGSDMSFT